ncbi:cleavage stimulation factor subunit 1 [Macrosteles quadrilineatus]|uniref:cleavage stimulation factor subunit 1 n=1 Tax=Macrosteles quadrilineatus TaxID=74068 RepID=UPI0023E32E6E|nr:cleavage stimulation factor subunit 1 [Macrosteles quadrilineatus]
MMKDNKDETEDQNKIKQRERLYRLIISQLYYDGYTQIAQSLSAEVHPEPACPPSERLLHVINAGLQHEPDRHKNRDPTPGLNPIQEILIGPGLDLEYETEVDVTAPEPALYETAYVTSHKANCRAGAFSFDGQLVATGSVDSSIKILDVDRMLAKSCPDGLEPTTDTQGHPVIRTLYDHLEEVTCLEFHPKEPFLASGSRDCTIKFFDYAKASVKKAFKTLTDVEQVKCMSFHPTGDFLVVGTNHPVIRLYDFNTGQCYVCNVPSHQHTAGITAIKFAQNARYFASSSRDGSIKLWDGVSNRCVNTFTDAHDGAQVCSIQFTRNAKYMLSSGKDSQVKLWELSTSRCLIAYTGAGTTGKQEHRAQAVFNHTEDFVMFPDEATTSLCAWNSRNASRMNLLSLGHNGPVRMIVHSPHSAAFLTCSDDFRARFWYKRLQTL